MTSLPENWRTLPDAHGWTPKKDPWIVSAANKTKDGLIICASRHGSPAMYAQMQALGVSYHDTEDGFIDQYDRWWNREQAYEIVKITGQPLRLDVIDIPGELFSENLY